MRFALRFASRACDLLLCATRMRWHAARTRPVVAFMAHLMGTLIEPAPLTTTQINHLAAAAGAAQLRRTARPNPQSSVARRAQ
jgi:hypothetical protein